MFGGLIAAGTGVVLALLIAFTGSALASGTTEEPIQAPLVAYGAR